MASERNKPIARRNPEDEAILSYASMEPAQIDSVLARRFGASLEALEAERECAYCKQIYREIDNIGAWDCAYHPGTLNYASTYVGKRYSCCGQAAGSRACMSCDHVMAKIYESNLGRVFISIPRYALNSQVMREASIAADAIMAREPNIFWVAQEFRTLCDIGSPTDLIEAAYDQITANGAVLVRRVDVTGLRRHPNIASLPFFSPTRQ